MIERRAYMQEDEQEQRGRNEAVQGACREIEEIRGQGRARPAEDDGSQPRLRRERESAERYEEDQQVEGVMHKLAETVEEGVAHGGVGGTREFRSLDEAGDDHEQGENADGHVNCQQCEFGRVVIRDAAHELADDERGEDEDDGQSVQGDLDGMIAGGDGLGHGYLFHMDLRTVVVLVFRDWKYISARMMIQAVRRMVIATVLSIATTSL